MREEVSGGVGESQPDNNNGGASKERAATLRRPGNLATT